MVLKIDAIGNICKGKLLIYDRAHFLNAIKSMGDCAIKIRIEKLYKKRSNQQNNYYWKVIVQTWKQLILDEYGEHVSMNETHEFLKVNFNYKEVASSNTGEIVRVPKSTTRNNTVEMEIFLETCRQKALEMFNCVIPLPNEQTILNYE